MIPPLVYMYYCIFFYILYVPIGCVLNVCIYNPSSYPTANVCDNWQPLIKLLLISGGHNFLIFCGTEGQHRKLMERPSVAVHYCGSHGAKNVYFRFYIYCRHMLQWR